MPKVLSRRALNRATMQRQLLLERVAMDPVAAVEHLDGLQAQEPRDPYVALWTRLAPFDPHELGRALEERRVVRMALMRATIHLVSASDALALRPLTQPVLDAELARHPAHAPHLRGVDVGPAMRAAAEALAERPMTPAQLRTVLGEAFPDLDGPSLAYAARCLLPLVQVPPRGVWGQRGQVTLTTTDAWLGRPLDRSARIDDVVPRYLAAFGPALPADVSTWCRLTGMREVLARMRPTLRVFHDERGRELFDVPDAPLPDPDTPAPVRFLPEYDNAVLSHSDRSRYTPDDMAALATDERVLGTVLVDGMIAATWTTRRDADRTTLVVRHLPGLARADLDNVAAEGVALARFIAPERDEVDVRLVAPG